MLEFRVPGLEFRVLGFRVYGLGFGGSAGFGFMAKVKGS